MLLSALFQMICSKWPMLEYRFFPVVFVVLCNLLPIVYLSKSICVSFSVYKLDYVLYLMLLYCSVWRLTFINIVGFGKFMYSTVFLYLLWRFSCLRYSFNDAGTISLRNSYRRSWLFESVETVPLAIFQHLVLKLS